MNKLFTYQIKYNSKINTNEVVLIPDKELIHTLPSIQHFIITNGLKYYINIRLYGTIIKMYFDKDCNSSLKNYVLDYINDTFKKNEEIVYTNTQIYDIYEFNITDPKILIKLL